MNSASENTATSGEQARPVPPRYWWLKRILIAVGILLLVLGAMRWWWGCQAQRRWEELLAKYRAAGQPLTLEDFRSDPIPDGDNAAILVQQAADVFRSAHDLGLKIELPILDPAECIGHQAEIDAYLSANSETLALLRAARARDGVDWGLPEAILIPGAVEGAWRFQELGWLVCTAATYRHTSGNDEAAVECLLDSMHLAHAVNGRWPTLLLNRMGVRFRDNATFVVECMASRLGIADECSEHADGTPASRTQVEALISRFLDDQVRRAEWSWAIFADRFAQLEALGLTHDRGPTTPSGDPRALFPAQPEGVPFFLRPIWQMDALRLVEATTQLREAGLAPNWPAARALVPAYTGGDSALEHIARPMSTFVQPAGVTIYPADFGTIARLRMAATALAIRLYELDHGGRPDSLAALVPSYLPTVPVDPFAADGREIAYLPHAAHPRLYSVGLDETDDQGTYTSDRAGYISDVPDLPLFLDGRPTREEPESRPSTAPSTQAVGVDDRQHDHEAGAHQDSRADEQP